MNDIEIKREYKENSNHTLITHNWIAPAGTAWVRIDKDFGTGDSSDHFKLEIEGGQVEFTSNPNGGILEIHGSWERQCLIELLKQTVYELELIESKIT